MNIAKNRLALASIIGVLSATALMGPMPGTHSISMSNPDKKGTRNGKPFNDGFDQERIDKAQAKRQRKQALRKAVAVV